MANKEYSHSVEWHGNSPYEDISDCQRSDEKVCWLPDLSVYDEGDEDEEVAECGDDDANCQ